ncbi:MAG: DUF4278 domain-containing protein [Oscillatoriaceae cyanobacterium]
MQLRYRGISYESTPPSVEITQTEAVGKYRGLDWRFYGIKKAPVQQATLDLKYRGVAYRTNATPVTAAAPVSQPVNIPVFSTADKARSLTIAHSRMIKKRQQAMLLRLTQEVGFTEGISHYWNRIQGKIHPTFRATYDRSAAALS